MLGFRRVAFRIIKKNKRIAGSIITVKKCRRMHEKNRYHRKYVLISFDRFFRLSIILMSVAFACSSIYG
jgi:hypothetical protein